MTNKSILTVLQNKTSEERQRFFVSLANNLVLAIRENAALESSESYERYRTILLNECVHRFLNHALSLYEEASCWSDREVFELVQSLSDGDATIINDVGAAIRLTSLAREME